MLKAEDEISTTNTIIAARAQTFLIKIALLGLDYSPGDMIS